MDNENIKKFLDEAGLKFLIALFKNKIPTDFYSKAEVDSVVANVKSEILGGAGEDYDTLKEIETWVETHQDLYQALVATVGEKTTLEAVQAWVKEQNYLTSVPEEYATKEYVAQEIAKVEVPELDGYATEDYVDEAIEGLSEVYQPKGNYLTEHQSLADYAKSSEVTSEIAEAVKDLAKKSDIPTDYLTEEDIEDFITENALEGYAKSEDVTSEIGAAFDKITSIPTTEIQSLFDEIFDSK